MESKGKERGHFREGAEDKASKENALPQFGMDYAFYTDECVLIEGGEEEEKKKASFKVAVMKEKKTQGIHAHYAQVRGASDEHVPRCVSAERY